MKKRICGLCFALVLLLSGCGMNTTSDTTNAPSTQTSQSPSVPTDKPTTEAEIHTTLSTTLCDNTTASFNVSTETTGTKSTSGTIDGIGSTVTTTRVTNTTTSTTATVSSASTTSTTAPSTITFTATVRNDQRQVVSDVIVTVWAGDDIVIGHGVTDSKGVARFTLISGYTTSYRVKLSNLPIGYEADSEYRFTSNTVNITIRKAAVQNEKDHSNAQYKVGRKMTDFSLTDLDGNVYRLSTLLAEKQLIVLDFWYTTCEPCKMEFPYFESAGQKYGDSLSLLAINPINDNAAMKALRQQLNASPTTAVTFPMLKDTCNLYLGFGVTSYPTTVFIDSNGIILDIHQGAYPSEEAFLAAVQRFIR